MKAYPQIEIVNWQDKGFFGIVWLDEKHNRTIPHANLKCPEELYATEAEANAACQLYVERIVVLNNNTALTPCSAGMALDAAANIIAMVGTTGIEHAHKQAEKWLRLYYPARL
jgi:hypothetical protein